MASSSFYTGTAPDPVDPPASSPPPAGSGNEAAPSSFYKNETPVSTDEDILREVVQDIVGAFVQDTATVTWTYNDTTGTLEATSAGGGAVDSVFGRTGIVVAVAGDYTATQITNTPAGTIAAVTVQAAIDELDTEKLAASSYTAADVLAKLLTVDGAGSGLDADLLDGQSSAFYATATSVSDHLADAVDAHDASAISYVGGTGMSATDVEAAIDELATEKLDASSYTAADVLSKLLTVDGSGSSLDADLLDGKNTGTSGNAVPLLDGTNTWSAVQTFSSTAALTATARFLNTNDSASVLVANFEGDRATPAANDEAYVSLKLSDSVGTQTEFARITWVATTVTDASEAGRLDFGVQNAGSVGVRLRLDNTSLRAGANDGTALGTTAVGWSDLHLATGGVINWANGEVTITETDANTLTIGGATLVDIGTANAFRTGTIELGAASDTTLARSGAGDMTIEGNTVYRAGGTDVALADGGTGASLTDPNLDRILMWDDSAGTIKFADLASLTTEGAPAAGDFLLVQRAEDDIVKVNWSSLPGAGGGISNVVEDTTPELGGDLETNNFSVIFEQYSADDEPAEALFHKSRNAAIGSHTIVQDGDEVGALVFKGSNGTSFDTLAAIIAAVDGTPGAATDMPGRLTFWTTPDASATPAERMRIDQAGHVVLGGVASTAYFFSEHAKLTLDTTGGQTLSLLRWEASASGPDINLGKGRAGTIGTYTVVQDGDDLGAIYFWGADSIDFARGAAIVASVDGTPGSGDMPTRLTFWTSPNATEAIVERVRIDESGRVVIGGGTAQAAVQELGNADTPSFQVQGTSGPTALAGNFRWSADGTGPRWAFVKSRGASIGTHTVVQDGDDLGVLVFGGSDGTDFEPGAAIKAEVDGTPGDNDMPGRLVFMTTSDAAATPTSRWQIISTGHLLPFADDTYQIGSTSLRIADIFLAEGAVINWDNGDFTLTQTGNSLACAGGEFVTAAGTTTEPGLRLTSGTAMTTPSAGAIEMDANCFYGTTDTGNRGYIPVRHFIRCDSTRTLPNDTNENAIFNSPANGRITLETGTYFFEALIRVTSMSATSGNALVDWLGAGTATAGAWNWWVTALDNTAPETPATNQGSFRVTQDSTASVATAGTGTALGIYARGTFEVTVAGTMIPSIDQVTAAAGIVAIGSYFVCERIGSTSVASVGQWD